MAGRRKTKESITMFRFSFRKFFMRRAKKLLVKNTGHYASHFEESLVPQLLNLVPQLQNLVPQLLNLVPQLLNWFHNY